ncbi:MAG: histidine phosphatase family protein [Clostridia bacterium]
MKIAFIRHGATAGNLQGCYIGTTDEPLTIGGASALSLRAYPPARLVYTSPLCRCRETAARIYPGVPTKEMGALRECDFGDFEGKNYLALNGRADYQAWLDSGGTLPFPGGESREAFTARCVRAFDQIVAREADADAYCEEAGAYCEAGASCEEAGASCEKAGAYCEKGASREAAADEIAIVAHGGTIMAILSERAMPRRDYFTYQVKNGEGFLTVWQGGVLRVLSRIGKVDHA